MKETRAPNNDSGQYKDKDIIGGTPGTSLIAEDKNAIQEELLAIQDALNLVRSYSDLEQVKKAIGLQAVQANFFLDTGSANAYVLNKQSNVIPPIEVREGMTCEFRASATNTGASTVTVQGGSAIDIKRQDNSDLQENDIEKDSFVVLYHNGTDFILSDNNILSVKNYKDNLFDNGGMQIYQRAVAHTLVKDVYGFAIDRFSGMATGTAVSAGTLTQETSSTLNNTGFSAKFSGLTLTGTGIVYFRQRIASQDAVKLKNQNGSIQFKVLHDVGSAVDYTIYVRKADANNDFTTSTNISNSGAISVETATDTIIKYENVALGDCSDGLEIEVKIECGAITSKNFEFANAKLEIGEVCTDFITKDHGQDVSNCQRYFLFSNQQMYCTTHGQTNGSMFIQYQYPQPMVKNPDVHVYNAATQAIDSVFISGFGNCPVTYYRLSPLMFVYFTANGYTGTIHGQISKFTANAEL